ncbi:MAG: ATP-binding protein [Candidatus Competibacter denitrificans]
MIVRDTGPGILPQERERVFDRFYRSAEATVPGSGLGLAIVKRIADRYGARIDLDSPADGSGLAVTVRFPSVTSMV